MNFRQQPMHVEDTMGFSLLGDFFNFDKNGKIILSTLYEWMKYIYMADIACEVCDTNIERETGGLNKCHILAKLQTIYINLVIYLYALNATIHIINIAYHIHLQVHIDERDQSRSLRITTLLI